MAKIIVFGSINIDLVARSPHLPIPGETLQGHSFFTAAGGKGANQAVAVAKLGISTFMVGRVGGDNFGQELLTNLELAGVKTSSIFVDKSDNSGVAAIVVGDRGENQIVIIPGANGKVNEEDIARLINLLPGSSSLLLQLEIPLISVILAAKAAKKIGVPVILDPAPAKDIPAELYLLIDIITPNETEVAQLVGFKVDTIEAAEKAADILCQRGAKTALVKMGDRGIVCATLTEKFFIPSFSVQAVDTVAAGDAFNGGLAVALAEGRSLREAIIWGAAAGAICATKFGAQPSMPDRQTFEAFLKQKGIF